jgi:hypothetical protein
MVHHHHGRRGQSRLFNLSPLNGELLMAESLMSAQGPGSVSVTFEVEGSLEFLSVGSPSYVIYTGRFRAPIRRYPMHGQELGRARVSQDPLQGLRLAVLSCLCCLGNTHLQPPNLLPGVGPINGFPRQRRWGGGRIG